MHLIPDDPFPEIGHPYTTDVSADGRWIAVNCSGGRDGLGRGRVVVYRAGDLVLWDEIVLEHSIEHLTFHPVLPLLAVGTEGGDEFELRGGLHLYEVETRRRSDVVVAGRGVTYLRWRDARHLEVTFARSVTDFDDPVLTYTRSVVGRDDWRGLTADVLATQVSWPQVPAEVDWGSIEGPDLDQPRRCLAGFAAEKGRAWARRAGTSLVEVLGDGRMLVSAEGGALVECWSPDGVLQWAVPVPDDSPFLRNGCRWYVTPDEESVWATVLEGDSANRRTLVRRFALADGAQLAELRYDFPVAIASRTDGAWVARDSRELFPGPRWPPYESVVLTPSGRRLATLALGECGSSFDFPVRRSPHLFFLYGVGGADVRVELLEKWVVRADPGGTERLFPLAWDDSLGPFLRGGPAVYVDDEAGPGIVHTCTVRDATHLVRRAYPGGAVVWAHRFDAQVTGVDVDAHGGFVHAVLGAGACELLTLRAADGTVVRRGTLTHDGHVYTPTCLSAGPEGVLVIGTVEGRLIRTSYPAGRSDASGGADSSS
ncbi:hypothetical protein [Streptomyces sp. NPDC051214]|uniref:hypothetical protein n=1 Tax=Streptomyces sp. NPDC051214 TaxID=3155282 RepID=UPI00343097EB